MSMEIWLNRPVYPTLRLEQPVNTDVKDDTLTAFANCSEFQAFRNKLNDLLEEWANDKTLERFRQQHDALRKSFNESNQLERKFIEKCTEFECRLKEHEELLSNVIQLSSDNHATIACLRKEIEFMMQKTETRLQKDQNISEVLLQLKEQIPYLNQLLKTEKTGINFTKDD